MIEGNNVEVIIPVQFQGAGATPDNIERFKKGIRHWWGGNKGHYHVKVRVVNQPPGPHTNVITIPVQNARVNVTGGLPGNHCTIGANELLENCGWVAAHEAGHLMGLDDRYNRVTGRPNPGWAQNGMGAYGSPFNSTNIHAIIEINGPTPRRNAIPLPSDTEILLNGAE